MPTQPSEKGSWCWDWSSAAVLRETVFPHRTEDCLLRACYYIHCTKTEFIDNKIHLQISSYIHYFRTRRFMLKACL